MSSRKPYDNSHFLIFYNKITEKKPPVFRSIATSFQEMKIDGQQM